MLAAVLGLWIVSPSAPAVADAGGESASAERLLLLDVAIAGPRLVAVGERGRILISADQGKSWSYASAPGEATLTAVYFHDDLHGWAVGHDAVILRSEDGGASWALVHQAPDERLPLLDVWFQNPTHGFAVGAYGYALESRDGGRKWAQRKLLPGDMHLNAVAGGTNGRVYLAGEAGTLLRSDDAGRSWRRLPSPYRGSWFGVLRLADGNPLVFGLRGRAYRSPDGGNSWVAVDTQAEATLQGGTVLGDGSVILVGNDGSVLMSRDGGRRFTRRRHELRQAFASVTAVGASLVLVGEHGVTVLPRFADDTGQSEVPDPNVPNPALPLKTSTLEPAAKR